MALVDSLGRHVPAVLVQHQPNGAALLVGLERNLRRHDRVEEVSLALGEDLELFLVRQVA